MSPATHGLYLAVAAALIFLAGMLAMAGILARYVVRAVAREQRADDIRESLYAADWRPVDPERYLLTCTTMRLPRILAADWATEMDISLWDTQRLALVPVQRTAMEAAA